MESAWSVLFNPLSLLSKGNVQIVLAHLLGFWYHLYIFFLGMLIYARRLVLSSGRAEYVCFFFPVG